MSRPYDFSSMTALICFEAAARHVSFKKAAQEMNVTPAAISHQIKTLEEDLRCSLFRRHPRGVELTEKGALLSLAIQRGFEAISEAVIQVRERPEKVDVTVGTTTAVSSLWLTHKITTFWRTHPAITISQIISDVPGMTNRCDLNVHYGSAPQDNVEYRKLFQGQIVALGTPGFAAEWGISRLADLSMAPLIHSNSEGANWTAWADWFSTLGYPAPKGRSFFVNNYMIALQTAQDDAGAVLGWDELVGNLMKDGSLVKLVPESIPAPAAFYLRIHPRASAKARAFADWLGSS